MIKVILVSCFLFIATFLSGHYQGVESCKNNVEYLSLDNARVGDVVVADSHGKFHFMNPKEKINIWPTTFTLPITNGFGVDQNCKCTSGKCPQMKKVYKSAENTYTCDII